MAEKTPLEILLAEITKLMDQLREFENTPLDKIPEDFEKRLTEMELFAELMGKLNNDTFSRLGFNEEHLKQIRSALDELPAKEKHLLERTQKLRREAEEQKRLTSIGRVAAKQRHKIHDPSERKKKFDRFGAKKDWRPL